MPCSKNYRSIIRVSVRTFHTDSFAIVKNNFIDTSIEMYLTATINDGVANVFNNFRQFVRADVGVGINKNIL